MFLQLDSLPTDNRNSQLQLCVESLTTQAVNIKLPGLHFDTSAFYSPILFCSEFFITHGPLMIVKNIAEDHHLE